MLIGEGIQLNKLFVGNDVAGRVGWPGDADHPRLFGDLQMFEVHVILELAFRQQLNVGTGGDKQILFQPGIGVADIFWR